MDTVLLGWCSSTNKRFCDRSLRSVQVLHHSGNSVNLPILIEKAVSRQLKQQHTTRNTQHATHNRMCNLVFVLFPQKGNGIGRSEIQHCELGRVSNFNKWINRNHHMKDHVVIGHLTKHNAFRVNKDQAMNLEIWLKIHANVSNFETASPEIV